MVWHHSYFRLKLIAAPLKAHCLLFMCYDILLIIIRFIKTARAPGHRGEVHQPAGGGSRENQETEESLDHADGCQIRSKCNFLQLLQWGRSPGLWVGGVQGQSWTLVRGWIPLNNPRPFILKELRVAPWLLFEWLRGPKRTDSLWLLRSHC